MEIEKQMSGDFSDGPVLKTPHSQCEGQKFDPWSGNQISRATAKTWHDQIHFNRSKGLVSEGWLDLQSSGTQSGLCSLGLPSFSHHARIMFFTDISDSQISLIFSISLGSWDRPSISLFQAFQGEGQSFFLSVLGLGCFQLKIIHNLGRQILLPCNTVQAEHGIIIHSVYKNMKACSVLLTRQSSKQ